MRIRKYGHSCLLVEEAGARLLLDPGTLSAGFEALTGLTALLITHQHPDHLDLDRVAALAAANPDARLIADEASAGMLAGRGVTAETVHDGDELEVGGVGVRVAGTWHATIHPDLDPVPNVGYLVGGRLFHPGDAFTDPGAPVDVLAVPAGAPWLKASEAVDYLRAVRPKVAVPIHEKVLAFPAMAYGLLDRLGRTDVRVLDDGRPLDL